MWHINSFHFNWIHKTDERLKLSVQVTAHSTTIVLTPPPLKKEKIVKKKINEERIMKKKRNIWAK